MQTETVFMAKDVILDHQHVRNISYTQFMHFICQYFPAVI